MMRRVIAPTGIGAGFLLLLFYLALDSSPPLPPVGADHDARGAERSCLAAVREELPEASFPFSSNPRYLGDQNYQLSGTVEAPISGETVRQNYECFVRYRSADVYRTDSVRIWQSH